MSRTEFLVSQCVVERLSVVIRLIELISNELIFKYTSTEVTLAYSVFNPELAAALEMR